MSAVIKVSLRTTKGKPLNRRKFDWKKLESQEIKDEFKIKLSNRFQHLPLIESITERYDEFEKATYSVARVVLGKKPLTGLPSWVSKRKINGDYVIRPKETLSSPNHKHLKGGSRNSIRSLTNPTNTTR